MALCCALGLTSSAGAEPAKTRGAYAVDHLRQVAAAWSLEIVVPKPDEPFRRMTMSCSAPDDTGLERIAVILEQELPLYPIEALEAAPIDTIYLCTNLRVGPTPVAGVAQRSSRAIFLEVDPGSAPVDHLRSVIHHELAHTLEDLYSDDFMESWAAYNLAEFEYLQATVSLGDVGLTWGSMTTPGFATSYGMTNTLEDRAELYAHLMTRFDATLVRGERDPTLRAKTRALMRELSEVAPGMDADFWRLVRGHQRARQRVAAPASVPPAPRTVATGEIPPGVPTATCASAGAREHSPAGTPVGWVVLVLSLVGVQRYRGRSLSAIPSSGSHA